MAVNGPSHLPGGDERSFATDAREKRVASTPGKTAVWGVDHTEESKISRYDVRRRLARGKMKNSSAAPSRGENPGTRANARSYPSALNKKPQVLSSQTVYAGKVFGIRRDEVIEPSGVRTTRGSANCGKKRVTGRSDSRSLWSFSPRRASSKRRCTCCSPKA